jgi:hypothetical protein
MTRARSGAQAEGMVENMDSWEGWTLTPCLRDEPPPKRLKQRLNGWRVLGERQNLFHQ